MCESTNVHFFVEGEGKETPLQDVSMASIPVVGQRIYFTRAGTGKGVSKRRYEVIRCDWSFMQMEDQPPTKHLEVCLKEVKV